MGTRGNIIVVRTTNYSETRFIYPLGSGNITKNTITGSEPFTYTVAGSLLTLNFNASVNICIERIL